MFLNTLCLIWGWKSKFKIRSNSSTIKYLMNSYVNFYITWQCHNLVLAYKSCPIPIDMIDNQSFTFGDIVEKTNLQKIILK